MCKWHARKWMKRLAAWYNAESCRFALIQDYFQSPHDMTSQIDPRPDIDYGTCSETRYRWWPSVFQSGALNISKHISEEERMKYSPFWKKFIYCVGMRYERVCSLLSILTSMFSSTLPDRPSALWLTSQMYAIIHGSSWLIYALRMERILEYSTAK